MPADSSNKRQRLDPIDPSAGAPVTGDDAFIQDHDAVEASGDEDDDDEKPKSDKKAGRRKIKIEFIQDKSRRHITFSKRKAGIMKKAYELSTLTGTQVLLLVVSETGLVYTFTTAKLQPLVTQPEGKNLIQACLNAPHGQLPSSMPVGTPLGRSSGPMVPPHSPSQPAPPPNVPGGLAIGGKDDDANEDNEGPGASDTQDNSERNGRKRRRAGSTTNASSTRNAASASGPPSGPPPPPPPPPSSNQSNSASGGSQNQPPPPPPPSQQGGSATSPHSRQQMPLPPSSLSIPGSQGQVGGPQSPSYAYAGGDASAMYAAYGQGGAQAGPGGPQGAPYGYAQGVQAGHDQAAAPPMTWGAPGVQQSGHYTTRR